LKFLLFVFVLVYMFTGCSQKKVEVQKPIEKVVVKKEPIKGLIPENVIQKAERKYGFTVRTRYEAYNQKILELQDASTDEKLEKINQFFNTLPYLNDLDVWGVKDYWSSPLEFLGKAKGDCEDYVIAKYNSLKNLGVKVEKMFFTYARAAKFSKNHMVLSYFETPNSVPLVLDSINYKIFPADKRKDLTPLYNYNGTLLYKVEGPGKNGQRVKNRAHIDKQWNTMLRDIERNKF